MPDWYPIYLNLKQKRCVVVGGGGVAERKVNALLSCGAEVTVISPTLSPGLQELAAKGQIRAITRSYQREDLEGAVLAIAATNRAGINAAIRQDARSFGVLVNVVDDPSLCDFIVPAVIHRGDLTICISTGGRSPALARMAREGLEQSIGPEYGHLLTLLAKVRQELKARGQKVSYSVWQKAVTPGVLSLLKEGKTEEAERNLIVALEGRTSEES
ncbi:MAG: bifunctional precorrin-2 dehydrogenase/sirohydrochlorin ferrochelatase [Chloroflexi bacterium]|nr:bifunctional precorrin-2 dehydrogenase/sirohydrochlorin ferrochelatase [Chloroflexota bacterium]MCL5075370.1 bifunctional precorrin-2 dehydrogenase/sirohydrochlorin ferrochelatase [Chloroflexota bacterium]